MNDSGNVQIRTKAATNGPQWKTIYESPLRLLLIIAATIFVVHILAMEMFSTFIPHCPMLTAVITESGLLSGLLFPVLYCYSFRPLIVHIRERDQAEQAMRQSEYKYRHLFENLSDAVFLTVVDSGRVIDTNKQGEVLLGCTRSEILGMNRGQLFPLEQVEESKRQLRNCSSSDTTMQYEAVVVRRNGTLTPVHVSGIPITLHDKRLVIELFREFSK